MHGNMKRGGRVAEERLPRTFADKEDLGSNLDSREDFKNCILRAMGIADGSKKKQTTA